MPTFDFGFGGSNGDVQPSNVTDVNQVDANNQPVPPDNSDNEDINNVNKDNKDSNADNSRPPVEGGDNPDNNNNSDNLAEGTVVEIEDAKYTIDKDGNLINDKGEVFKEAKDVKEFLAQFEAEDEKKEVNINNIQAILGTQIVDENDKPIEFDNTPEGVAAYVEAVIDRQKDELAIAGVNKLIETYPFVQDVINYYVANGGSLDGFGEIKDRSNITIDDNNIAQQEAIIREAHKESGRRDNVDKYIQYLKDSGQLLDAAKEALQAMIDSDKAEREKTAKEAAKRQKEYEEQQTAYWNAVKETIDNRKIAGYEIPETIILNKDGKKVATTPNDFFNYLYQVDENGRSRYINDLAKLTPEQRRDDEVLRAYLTYTGGSYADLVNMAIKEKEVKTLKLKAINNAKRSIRITPPANNNKVVDTDFGY